MMDKKALRLEIKKLKQELSPDEISRQEQGIFDELVQNESFVSARYILFYWSMADEIHTHDFILQHCASKHIYLPAINGNDLNIVEFKGMDSLRPGEKYGIPEPCGAVLEDESLIELVVVPGVAFDWRGNRMGRGGGYYDRILKRLPWAVKIALAYDIQMVNEVPVESHDIAMDQVIYRK